VNAPDQERDHLLDEKEVAARYKLSTATLSKWRLTPGKGPKFFRLGHRCVRYRLADVEAWLTSCAVEGGAL
jgi:predicted DNA-binding transcriptional regulator AlpA